MRFLTLLHVVDASRYTLKAFRAGRVTALAASGASIGEILLAGEWKSFALMRYIDMDAVDQAQLLNAALDASDKEDEPEEDVFAQAGIL